MAAEVQPHKFSGLKQHKSIFYGLEGQKSGVSFVG